MYFKNYRQDSKKSKAQVQYAQIRKNGRKAYWYNLIKIVSCQSCHNLKF